MKLNVKIKRGSTLQEYSVEVEESSTILDVLNTIKEDIDPTLSYRSMCRSAVCGTCGVRVNYKPVLACSSKVKDFGEEVFIEPLSGFEIIKDLVIDHDVFLERLRGVYPQESYTYSTGKERPWECIMCGLCDSVCPVLLESSSFGGPMFFLRSFKYAEEDKILELIRGKKVDLCTHCKNCSFACPKLLYPELSIKEEEDMLVSKGLLHKQSFGFDFLQF